MSGSVVDSFMKSVTGAVRIGRDMGGRAATTAGPAFVGTVEAVRSRLTGPHPKPATSPTPEASCRTPRPRYPTPATVAKNIAKHDPATEPDDPEAEAGQAIGTGSQAPGTEARLRTAYLSSELDSPSTRRATISCWICWVPSKMSRIFESRAHFSRSSVSL